MELKQFKSFFCFLDGSASTPFWIVKLAIKLIYYWESISLWMQLVLKSIWWGFCKGFQIRGRVI
jgi:hypothetical protein